MSRLGRLLYGLAALGLITYIVASYFVFLPILWVILALSGVLVIAAIGVDYKFYLEFFSMKTTKKGLSTGALCALVLLLLIAVNILGIKYYKSFDYSSAKRNSLSDQSITVVKALKEKLTLKLFYDPNAKEFAALRGDLRGLVKMYEDASDKVSLEFIDMQANPRLTQEYGISGGGVGYLFIEYESKKEKIETPQGSYQEQDLTHGIIKVTREKSETLYFLAGHGEVSLSDSSPQGMSYTKSVLEGVGYIVKELDLAQAGQIPADTSALFIVGPKIGVSSAELSLIEKYMREGGNVFLALRSHSGHGYESLLGKLGLKFDENYLFRVFMVGQEFQLMAMIPILKFDGAHPITKPFNSNTRLVLKTPQTITDNKKDGIETQNLLMSDKAFVSFNTAEPTAKDQGARADDKILAVSAKGKLEGATKEFKAVVLGEADVFTNAGITKLYNRDFVANSAAYFTNQSDLASIAAREPAKTDLLINQKTWFFYIIGFLVPVPLILIFTSGFLFFRRRSA